MPRIRRKTKIQRKTFIGVSSQKKARKLAFYHRGKFQNPSELGSVSGIRRPELAVMRFAAGRVSNLTKAPQILRRAVLNFTPFPFHGKTHFARMKENFVNYYGGKNLA